MFAPRHYLERQIHNYVAAHDLSAAQRHELGRFSLKSRTRNLERRYDYVGVTTWRFKSLALSAALERRQREIATPGNCLWLPPPLRQDRHKATAAQCGLRADPLADTNGETCPRGRSDRCRDTGRPSCMSDT